MTSSDYRCERCSDVASSIEAHGFCLIAPRELIDAHEEFVAMQNNGRRVEWMKRDGVFHPVVTLEAAGKLLSHGGIMGDNTPKDIERND